MTRPVTITAEQARALAALAPLYGDDATLLVTQRGGILGRDLIVEAERAHPLAPALALTPAGLLYAPHDDGDDPREELAAAVADDRRAGLTLAPLKPPPPLEPLGTCVEHGDYWSDDCPSCSR